MSEPREPERTPGGLLKEPLVHFLALGALLFAAYQGLNGDASEETASNVIVVDRAALLEFMQYRSKAFEPDVFAERLDNMPDDERRALIGEFVREEALYREARAMGLQENDYVIRQRVVQSLKFLLDAAASRLETPTDEQLETYLSAHREVYAEPATYTFTHVFLDREKHGDAGALQQAREMLPTLQAGVEFDEAPRYGDRFPYFTNYVERRRDFVASHFGPTLTDALDDIDGTAPQWAGPFPSPYGWHLVLLTKRQPPRFPALEELRARLVEDYRRDARELERRAALDRLVGSYDVRLSEGLDD